MLKSVISKSEGATPALPQTFAAQSSSPRASVTRATMMEWLRSAVRTMLGPVSSTYHDLVVLLRRATSKLDMGYIEQWAKMLDESIGGDEVTERVQRALKTAPRK